VKVLSRVERICESRTGRSLSPDRGSTARYMQILTCEQRPKETVKIGPKSVCTAQLTDKQHLCRPSDWWCCRLLNIIWQSKLHISTYSQHAEECESGCKVHASVNAAPDGGEWWSSRGLCIYREIPTTHWTVCRGPQKRSKDVRLEKTPLLWKIELWPSVMQPTFNSGVSYPRSTAGKFNFCRTFILSSSARMNTIINFDVWCFRRV
jgi:hypothetical protein